MRRPPPRPETGLTTLEWLLIVAAVAALAAIAVVVVQDVIGDTAQQIDNHNARQHAAELAAAEVATAAESDTPTSAQHAEQIN
ncbi:hypothetical protein [Candidatus Poriferisodalis sp.]